MEANNAKGIRYVLFRPLMTCLGLILIAAGLLKVRELANGMALQLDWSPPAQRGLAIGEVVVGIWFLLGIGPIWARGFGIALFCGFFNIAFLQYLRDLPSCSCMGEVTVRPLYIAVFDAAAVVLLVSLVPSPPAPKEFRGARWAIVGASVVFGIIWALSAAFDSRPLVATEAEAKTPANNDRELFYGTVLPAIERTESKLESALIETRDTATSAPQLGTPQSYILMRKYLCKGGRVRRDTFRPLGNDATELIDTFVLFEDRLLQYSPKVKFANIRQTDDSE